MRKTVLGLSGTAKAPKEMTREGVMPEQNAVTGGCLCGAVRYEAYGPPSLSVICHCRMCQRASGAPFMGLLFMPSDAVKVIKGYPRVYHSSPTSDRHFCPACGSPLFFVRGVTTRSVQNRTLN